MTKAYTPKQIETVLDAADIAGYKPRGFAAKVLKALPAAEGKTLVEVFAKVLKADTQQARRTGIANETKSAGGHYGAKAFKPLTRDNAFAAKLPKGLRAEFFATVLDSKQYAYTRGVDEVSHKRSMERLDAILADPEQAQAFWRRTEENAHLRDPIMFPRLDILGPGAG